MAESEWLPNSDLPKILGPSESVRFHPVKFLPHQLKPPVESETLTEPAEVLLVLDASALFKTAINRDGPVRKLLQSSGCSPGRGAA